jgi:hypothetical protein
VDGAHVDPAAFPSGHATAAMSIALAAVLVAPPRARPFAALLGAAFALSMGFCIVSLGWHFPSDVVGGFLLATGWTLVIAAALRAAAGRWPERSGRTRVTAAFQRGVDAVATLGAAALAFGLVLGTGLVATTIFVSHPSAVVDFADEHTAIVAVGAGIALAAAVLLAGVTAALRRS